MAINDETRQLQIARDMEDAARTLAHSTQSIPNPPDSYQLLGELRSTVDMLEQVCRQLGAWHSRVVDGTEYRGEDERGDGATGTVGAAAALERAAAALSAASEAISEAHSSNGVVRWVSNH